jgi:hypothetical protein
MDLKLKKKNESELFGEIIYFITNNGLKNSEITMTAYLSLYVHHLFDTIDNISDKISLMNFIQKNNYDTIEYDIREQIKSSLFISELVQYIKSTVFTYRKKSYIYLITDPILKKEDFTNIPGTYFILNEMENKWEVSPELMHNELSIAKNKQLQLNVLSRTIQNKELSGKTGFIGYQHTKNEVVFKMKNVEKIKPNLQVQTLKGLTCLQATPHNILQDLRWVADAASENRLYNIDDIPSKSTKGWLCALLELTLRRLTQMEANNKVWFVSTEVAVDFHF